MFNELVGQKVTLRIEISWAQSRQTVDPKVNGPLDGIAAKENAVPSIKDPEMSFAMSWKGENLKLPVRSNAKTFPSSKRQFNRLRPSQVLHNSRFDLLGIKDAVRPIGIVPDSKKRLGILDLRAIRVAAAEN
jgi:hypothetical protein